MKSRPMTHDDVFRANAKAEADAREERIVSRVIRKCVLYAVDPIDNHRCKYSRAVKQKGRGLLPPALLFWFRPALGGFLLAHCHPGRLGPVAFDL